MRRDQAETYLDFIRDVCRGVFYYHNQDHQPRNFEIENLSDCLPSRFAAREINAQDALDVRTKAQQLLRSSLRNLAVRLGLAQRAEKNLLNAVPYRTFLCRPL
jgi:hypothetical protein